MSQHAGDDKDEPYSSNGGDESLSHPLNDPEEQQVLLGALDSYRQYRKNAHYNITHQRRQNIYALPRDQWKLLAAPPFSLLDTLSQIDDAIDINADLSDAIFEVGLQSMGIGDTFPANSPQPWHNKAKPNDHAKAYSTLRQLYRDWSAEGFQREVKPTLDLILSDLHPDFPSASHAKILVPGTGLGRLLFELTVAGYHCTGNEISYHQILASNYILNHTPHANSHTIHPFLSSFGNNLTRTTQLSAHAIPDIHPPTAIAQAVSSGHTPGTMSMTSGDFILCYSSITERHQYDAIVTVYFIDTCPNLFRYISTVHNALKPGGLWINIGPLLWHFDNRSPPSQTPTHKAASPITTNTTTQPEPSTTPQSPSPSTPISSTSSTHDPSRLPERIEDTGIAEPGSFELSNDEVLLLVEQSGFSIEKSETNLDAERYGGYIRDRESMLQSLYWPVHWVARKTR